MQLQSAMISTVYPEFRHDLETNKRAQVVWPDLLTLAACVVFPLAACGAVLLPYLIPLLFGQGWDLAARLSVALSLVAGLQVVVALLASAVEALGRFSWIWSSQLLVAGVYSVAAISAFSLRDWMPIIVGLFAGLLVQHSLHIYLCVRGGYLSIRSLVEGYMRAVAGALGSALLAWVGLELWLRLQAPWNWMCVVVLAGAVALALWRLRERLTPVVIARKYNLL